MIVKLGNKQPQEEIKPHIRLKPSKSLALVFLVLVAFVGGYIFGKTLYERERTDIYNLKPIKLYIYDEKGDSLLYYLESYQKGE